MKTRDFLWGMLASMFLVGCSQNEDAPGGENGKDGKEYSYIAVKVNAASDSFSRADGEYDGGTKDENKVGDAYFFFFDGGGNAFDVTSFNPENTQAGDGQATNGTLPNNCVKHSFNDDEGAEGSDENVERSLAAVLVLKNITTSYPASVVTVLGGLPSDIDATTLDKLRACLLTNYKNDAYFIMSNSVYEKDNKEVYSTALTPADFAKTQAEAEANPVTIHVERVAAKVVVNVGSGVNADKIAVKDKESNSQVMVNIGDAEKLVIAKILGWDINTTIDKSYVVKDIANNENWETTLGFEWNQPTDYRSFWSNTPTDDVTFDKTFKFSDFNKTLETADYCMENTTSSSNYTKVIVQAQLGYEEGENFRPLDMAQWMGIYCLNEDLKGMVVTHLKDGLYYRTNPSDSWKSIAVEETSGNVPGLGYIKLVRGDGDNIDEASDYYQATFDLDETSLPSGIEWSFDGINPIKAVTDGEGNVTKAAKVFVAEKLKSLAPAKIWTEGKTYYYLDIKHISGSGGQVNKAVIRNHVYQINIEGIVGLGTPVYLTSEDEDPQIPEVVTPEDTETFLAAKINILSWKIVNNDVTLGE